MSAERIYIPGLDSFEQDAFDGLLSALREKTPRNLLRASYYDMKNAVRHLGIAMPADVAAKVGTVLGWSAKAVDILNTRCRLEGFTADADLDSMGLGEISRANMLDTESRQSGLSSLLHGTAFVVTTLGDTASGEPPVIITGKDGLGGTGTWDRRKRAVTSFLSVIETDEKGDPSEFVLYLPNLNISCARNGAGWIVDRRRHVYGVPVDPLPYRPRLERPLGRSRISRAVMSLHDAAVRSVIRSELTAELYSVAQMILLGVDESAFVDSSGAPSGAFKSVFGRLWAIGRDENENLPDVKQFSGASQQPHMDQLRSLAQMFSGETAIPLASLGISADANPTSAQAYEAARADLVTEAEDTTDAWSPAWSRTAARALQMFNGWDAIPAEVAAIAPKWRPAQYQSRAALADAAQKTVSTFPWLAETDLGLELFGLDDEFIKRAMAAKRRGQVSSFLTSVQDKIAATTPPATQDATQPTSPQVP